ncbi:MULTISPECIES: Hpt domain-containing protein [unclassified Roseivivax]|uniref:Hpt domain-containing protein n=1 Tax=Roseivivax sp. GX 12232 TaxID=2900547 RepID=UPI001E337381|nr:Hpt domain-containing protein [Roseivivax sp. GX 12232]MCE0505063.1 Hpt domain-containing protein [Roseivivax sp. GX 12232]
MNMQAREVQPDPAITAIREKFLSGLETRLAELDSLSGLLKGEANRARVWEEIRLRVHRIAGVAGSLGFAALGARSGRLDTAIEHYLNKPANPRDEATLSAALEGLLDDIDQILEEQAAA